MQCHDFASTLIQHWVPAGVAVKNNLLRLSLGKLNKNENRILSFILTSCGSRVVECRLQMHIFLISSNEYPQHMFTQRNKKNKYFRIKKKQNKKPTLSGTVKLFVALIHLYFLSSMFSYGRGGGDYGGSRKRSRSRSPMSSRRRHAGNRVGPAHCTSLLNALHSSW